MTKMSEFSRNRAQANYGGFSHSGNAYRRLARLLIGYISENARMIVFATFLVGITLYEGCLWAPDIHERSSGNQPPQLDYSLMEPDPDMKVIMTGPTIFSVTSAVFDPDDPVKDLNYWWFLDYRQTQGQTHTPAISVGTDTIQLDPCIYPQLADTNKDHTLEVIVVDPSGKVTYDLSRNRKIEHAVVGLWVIQSHANCQ